MDALLDQLSQHLERDGYCVMSNAVPVGVIQSLRQTLVEQADDIRPAGIGRGKDFQRDEQVRSDGIFWLDEARHCRPWFAWLEALRVGLNRRLYLGLNSYESHLSVYAPGAAYAKHKDAFRGEQNRRLSLVTYLNEDWQEDDAGALVLYTEDGSQVLKTVPPEQGTLVLFLSEHSPHEVIAAKRERCSVAAWFK